MTNPTLTPAEHLERKTDSLVRELDELLALATSPQRDMLKAEELTIGQIYSRAALLASLAMEFSGSPRLKVVGG